jgi:hypothetical protein
MAGTEQVLLNSDLEDELFSDKSDSKSIYNNAVARDVDCEVDLRSDNS